MALAYSTENLLISFQREFANRLLTAGYAVLWRATGETELPPSGDEPLDTVTLVPEFPEDPAYLVRPTGLNDGNGESPVPPGPETITVPAFALQIPESPLKMGRLGLGERQSFRRRKVIVDGFALDAFQHRALHDLLYEWLQVEPEDRTGIYLPVTNYRPASPVALDPAEVVLASVVRSELIRDVDAIRYYINATVVVEYVE